MIDRKIKIQIDPEVCDGCGQCVLVCPSETISIKNKKAQVTGNESIMCGHCIAACPKEAIRLKESEFDKINFDTFVYENKWMKHGEFNTSDLVRLMLSRRSCRNYKNKNIDKNILEDLIKIGTTAPSGSNCQDWTFTIIPTKKDVVRLAGKIGLFFRKLNKLSENTFLRKGMALMGKKKLEFYYENYYESVKESIERYETEKIDRLFHGANAVIMVGGSKKSSCPSEDALLATQNILLGAHAMGLGTCLIGFAVNAIANDVTLKSDLGVQKDEKIYSVIALGYPSERYKKLIVRKKIIPKYITF
ncbi:MAG: 4Fe-4S binding protein [Desulfobacula sp.]|uniref:nitroreductase family protein n=1 Tax=Desulfobacula sp. TaxID=2593537 RepID=UPI0039B901E2|nr:4Fe-4S binding protein [Desulfobacula sp.]